jgi:predicted ATPase/DNA-binding SARP family transcriptional activator
MPSSVYRVPQCWSEVGMLHVRLFGEFLVEVDGVRVAEASWPRREVRGLLQLLATRPGHRSSKAQAAEALWPGVDEALARNRLYNTVYLLRDALEPGRAKRGASSYIHTQGESLQLGPPEAVWVDADEFELKLDEAAACTGAHQLGLLEQATALYRGPLLMALEEQGGHGADRAHLEQRWRGALRALARLHTEQGSSDAAITLLQRLVRAEPSDEAAQCGLIEALEHTGRRAEALAQYRLCKEVLATELGVAPGPAAQALYRRLKAPDGLAAIEPSSGNANGANGDSPAAATSHRRPNPLPEVLTELVGRDAELQRLRTLVGTGSVRLLTLTGMGGVGKTRLAIRLAAELRSRFEHGVVFVPLASLSDPALLVGTLARALGLAQRDGTPPIETLLGFLVDKSLLLVLDNCEHLRVTLPALVAELLSRAPALVIATTSRTPLHLHDESLFVVPPLAVPTEADLGSVDRLARVPAVALFVQRAAAIETSFRITPDNAEAIAKICARLDGLPLAIELAAARCRLFAPAHLLARLDQRFEVLNRGTIDSPQRHRTLSAVLDWSYQLLEPAAQQLFAGLSVFSGGFTLAAVRALFGAIAAPDELVATLLDQNLLTTQAPANGAASRRFVMLETVQAYALQLLVERGELAATQRAHALFYAEMAVNNAARLRGPEAKTTLDTLEAEHDNLRRSLSWAIENDAATVYRAAAALSDFWFWRGHLIDGLRWYDAILGLDRTGLPTLRAKCLQAAARLAWHMGQPQDARRFLEESLMLRRAVGETHGIAKTLVAFGALLIVQSEHRVAIGLLQESLALGRHADAQPVVARALANLALALTLAGELGEARRAGEECLHMERQAGNAIGLSHALVTVAYTNLLAGDYGSCTAQCEEALALARGIGYKSMEAIALGCLGECSYVHGDLPRAEAWLETSRAAAQRSCHRYTGGVALVRLGKVALRCGLVPRALELLEQGLQAFKPMGVVTFIEEGLCALVEANAAAGKFDAARSHLRTLIGLQDRLADHQHATVVEAASVLAMAQGDAPFALRLLGGADAARLRLEVKPPPVWQAPRDRLLSQAHAEFGAPVSDWALAEGQQVELSQLFAELGHWCRIEAGVLVSA